MRGKGLIIPFPVLLRIFLSFESVFDPIHIIYYYKDYKEKVV